MLCLMAWDAEKTMFGCDAAAKDACLFVSLQLHPIRTRVLRPRRNRLHPLHPKSGRGGASLKGQGSKCQLTGQVLCGPCWVRVLQGLCGSPGRLSHTFQGDIRLLRLQVPLVLQRGHACPSGEQVPQGSLQVSVQSAVKAHHWLPAGADASFISELTRGAQCVIPNGHCVFVL